VSAGLWSAVDELTKPQQLRLLRDDGSTEWVRLPCLFMQLADAVQTGAGGHARGKQQSRPPLDIVCMSLLIDIAETVADACRSYDLKRYRDTPRDMRQVASTLVRIGDDDLTDWWVGRLHRWCGSIRSNISNDTDRPWHLQGLPCPHCAATFAPDVDEDGLPIRRPAVIVTWRGGYVRAVECRMCTAVWYRGSDLETLAEQILAQRHAQTA
jgi:hypothetical protein